MKFAFKRDVLKIKLLFIAVLLLLLGPAAAFSAGQNTDIRCDDYTETCPPSPDPCGCKNAAPLLPIGDAIAAVDKVYSAQGGRSPYQFDIGAGVIDKDSGIIREAPQCPQVTTVTVTDACKTPATKQVEFVGPGLVVGGPEDVAVDSQYGASGGSAPYTWAFDGGGIDTTGKVTAINDCGGPGETRYANVTVTDSCGKSVSKEVRLPGGTWVLVSNGGDPFWASAWMTGIEISGGTKTVKTYTAAGCRCFDNQILLSPAGSCQAYNPYCSGGDTGDTSGYWWGATDGTILDGVPNCTPISTPSKNRLDIPGFSGASSSMGGNDTDCEANGGNNYEVYGFRMYSHKPEYDDVYEWQCQ